MAVYRKVEGTTLYLRGEPADGYTLYSGEYITGSDDGQHAITEVIVEDRISGEAYCRNMFLNCWKLKTLDLSKFDTSNVKNMEDMFSNCYNLTDINVSGFDTSKVIYMGGMFSACKSLTSLNLSSFDTSNVIYFSTGESTEYAGMFSQCYSLKKLCIDNFTKSSSAYAYNMFSDCEALETIECCNTFDSSNSTGMFSDCTSLQGETAKGGIAYSSSKTTGAYAKINGGYFTYPKRTIETSSTGDGTITDGGTYDKGTEVVITVAPSTSDYAYIKSVLEDGKTELLKSHTASSKTFNLVLNNDTEIFATFDTREEHSCSATSVDGYVISGTGTYRYLDSVTLMAKISGLIAVDGWYKDTTNLSSNNPYMFSMPDEDLSLTLKTGSSPFTSENVRQFCLQNGNGQIYKLTNKKSNIFLNDPKGLGFAKKVSATRIGNASVKTDEQYSFPTIKGDIVFHNSNVSDMYNDYHNFVNFLSVAPIKLWYKLPVDTSATMETNVYYLDVEVTSFDKGEVSNKKYLSCSFEMNATSFYKYEDTNVTVDSSTATIYNSSNFEVGCELELSRTDNLAFDNPVITFSDSDGVYGKCAFTGEYDKVIINTKDGEEDIKLYNGNAIITNPFAYLDDSVADGTVAFPFPKLKQGYITIGFTYDDSGEETKSYVIDYAKEYISV